MRSVSPVAALPLAAATWLMLCTSPVIAQDTGAVQPAADSTTAPTPEASTQEAALLLSAPSPKDQLSITPYAWLTSFSGQAGARGQRVDVDQSFSDVLENADSLLGFMGAIDFQRGPWIFNLNSAFTRAEFERERTQFVTGPSGGSGIVGLRWTDLNLGVQANALADAILADGTPLQAGVAREVGGDATWFEPFVGARVEYRPNDRWTFGLRGDVGGFDVDGSSFAWQTVAYAGYTWQVDGWTLSLAGGYRALGQDYEEDGVTWDAVTHGPILGLSAGFQF
jgi:hypothetical protein